MFNLLPDIRRKSLRPVIYTLCGALVGLLVGMMIADTAYPKNHYKVEESVSHSGDADWVRQSSLLVGATVGLGIYAVRSKQSMKASK
jgi:hypothetical protein